MTSSADNFVDFQNVWLAYNDELLAETTLQWKTSTCKSNKASSLPLWDLQVVANPRS